MNFTNFANFELILNFSRQIEVVYSYKGQNHSKFTNYFSGIFFVKSKLFTVQKGKSEKVFTNLELIMIFLVKSKLFTAPKSKTVTNSRIIFRKKNAIIFTSNQSC